MVAVDRPAGPRRLAPAPRRLLEAQDVVAAHAAGLAVNTWTVDDPGRVAELAGWGVDAIVTNDVPATMAALGPRATEEDG